MLGEIKLFASANVPSGWARCDGQVLPIAQNQVLFALLGKRFGGGAATFALPDLRGRVPIHVAGGVELAAAGGTEDHQLSVPQLPAHTHPFVANDALAPDTDGTQPSPAKRLARSNPGDLYAPAGSLTPMSGSAVSVVGGSQSHENMQPYLALSFCIALQGASPPKARRRRRRRKWPKWFDKLRPGDG